MTTTLRELCAFLPVEIVGGDAAISAATLDSRRTGEGVLFAAVVDPIRNGEAYAGDALDRGAAAVLAARPLETRGRPLVIAAHPREVYGAIAHRLAGNPAEGLRLIAVTGTNGKTTFTYLVEAVLIAAGRSPGVIGTVSYRYAGRVEAAANTTPEADEIAALIGRMKAAGVTDVVMETSSHGLALSRVAGLAFDVAVFTNLSRDHMDFHATVDDYRDAKARLFTDYLRADGVAILNADDEAGRAIAARSRGRVLRWGFSKGADYRIAASSADRDGVRLTLNGPGDAWELASPLAGDYQIENVAAAVAACLEMGVDVETVRRAIASMTCVPGRMERVGSGGPAVYVDYAHTPGALENVAAACRRLTAGRLITVFGCGGDRDPGKRPLMARAAAGASDIVVVTSDNPRTEDPAAIIEQALAGLDRSRMDALTPQGLADYRGGRGLFVEPDRRAAIRTAVLGAREEDTVLIAGKGHEDYQILGRVKVHLDDREEAAAALALRGAAFAEVGS